ncbi:hypothetical protein DMA12_34110 [Amycolatopsis balhimycina DSM 5908]|uniref:Uncharacterized protein n=1 Tax=Amycolatopsis balhimycina DSM 5908 TaxID=1081091 RepID=A0A428W4U7_AMYBA|nr:hypothetical protein DMA12_34110 [Amycolatopsis balhimycina DSM 5908]
MRRFPALRTPAVPAFGDQLRQEARGAPAEVGARQEHRADRVQFVRYGREVAPPQRVRAGEQAAADQDARAGQLEEVAGAGGAAEEG